MLLVLNQAYTIDILKKSEHLVLMNVNILILDRQDQTYHELSNLCKLNDKTIFID